MPARSLATLRWRARRARLLVLTHFSQRYDSGDGQQPAGEAVMAFGGSGGSAGPRPEPDPRSAPAPASGQLAALQQAPAARAPGTLARRDNPPQQRQNAAVMHAVSH